ncbi:MAG: hypothetical protein KGR26_12290, partial [Cyanobacteria bacterium REEB65]|nr:hypothetical protein [Cyanobacteria bacterium REEB65]
MSHLSVYQLIRPLGDASLEVFTSVGLRALESGVPLAEVLEIAKYELEQRSTPSVLVPILQPEPI